MMNENKCYSVLIPFVGGGYGGKADTNYFDNKKFYWLPIYENEKDISDSTHSIQEILNLTKIELPKDIMNKVKDKQFHFDPILDSEGTSYGEPLDSGKAKRIINFLSSKKVLEGRGNCWKIADGTNVKIFFGAKFQDYTKFKENNGETTGLYIIGELNVGYIGTQDKLREKFPYLQSIINRNAHQRRKKKENFFIFIGKGEFYEKPRQFAKWNPDTHSFQIFENLKDGFGKTGRVARSVHLGKFNRDLCNNIK